MKRDKYIPVVSCVRCPKPYATYLEEHGWGSNLKQIIIEDVGSKQQWGSHRGVTFVTCEAESSSK